MYICKPERPFLYAITIFSGIELLRNLCDIGYHLEVPPVPLKVTPPPDPSPRSPHPSPPPRTSPARSPPVSRPALALALARAARHLARAAVTLVLYVMLMRL